MKHTLHVAPGDLLTSLLETQEHDARAVSYPYIEKHARELCKVAERLDGPIVVAVGDAAQRLVGVAVAQARGGINAPVWTTDVNGRDVLLVGTVAGSLVEFDLMAASLRRRGARHIYGCAITTASTSSENLDGFALLSEWPQAQLHTA